MLERLILATGSIGLHAAMLAVALVPPAIVRPGSELALTVRLIADAPRRQAVTSVIVFAELSEPTPVLPDVFIAEALIEPIAVATAVALSAYLPSSAMERRPTPISEPDIASIQTNASSGLPVRLRLYVDRRGQVVEVVTLVASDADAAFVVALARMFRATAFLPGQRAGVDVASYMDIELVAK